MLKWHHPSLKDKDSEVRLTWVQILTPLVFPVTTDESLSLSELILLFENCLVGLLGKLNWPVHGESSTIPGTNSLSMNASYCCSQGGGRGGGVAFGTASIVQVYKSCFRLAGESCADI